MRPKVMALSFIGLGAVLALLGGELQAASASPTQQDYTAPHSVETPAPGNCYLTPTEVGDWGYWNPPDLDSFTIPYPRIDCDLFHTLETYFVTTLPDEWPRGSRNPGRALDTICKSGAAREALKQHLGQAPERLPTVLPFASTASVAAQAAGARWIRCDIAVFTRPHGISNVPLAGWSGTLSDVRAMGGSFMFWAALPMNAAQRLRSGLVMSNPRVTLFDYGGVQSGDYGALMIWREWSYGSVPTQTALGAKAKRRCAAEARRWINSPTMRAGTLVTQWQVYSEPQQSMTSEIRCVIRKDPLSLGRQSLGFLGPVPFHAVH